MSKKRQMKAKETMLGSEIISLPGKVYVPASSLCLSIMLNFACEIVGLTSNKAKNTPLEIVNCKINVNPKVYSILISNCCMFLGGGKFGSHSFHL